MPTENKYCTCVNPPHTTLHIPPSPFPPLPPQEKFDWYMYLKTQPVDSLLQIYTYSVQYVSKNIHGTCTCTWYIIYYLYCMCLECIQTCIKSAMFIFYDKQTMILLPAELCPALVKSAINLDVVL